MAYSHEWLLTTARDFLAPGAVKRLLMTAAFSARTLAGRQTAALVCPHCAPPSSLRKNCGFCPTGEKMKKQFFLCRLQAVIKPLGKRSGSCPIRHGYHLWCSWLPAFADVVHLSQRQVPFPHSAPLTLEFGIRHFYVADPAGNLLEIGNRHENGD